MDYLSIKLFHLVGVMFLFLGLGGMVFTSHAGVDPAKKPILRIAILLPVIGLVLILVSGLAMLHSLGLLHGDPPGWAKSKFLIFLLFGGSIALVDRLSRSIGILITGWILLGIAAAYLALHKPF
ncbi:MAG: hypothetical protein LV481_16065 [Methylacidiphilales bacterium]|nr:hypothetical protein [Candidatus Methylacidiphilales bacterium]